MKKQAVLSLSGGMDSSTVLLHLLAEGYEVTALSFDYGQKHNVELERAAELIEYLDRNGHSVKYQRITLQGLVSLLNSNLVQGGEEVPEGHYEEENMKDTVVPNRNKMFSSIIQAAALSIANAKDCDVKIAMGIHAGDHAIYPDCRQEFRDADYKAFTEGNWDADKVTYYTPFLNGDKFDILVEGQSACHKLGIDFDEVYKRTNTSYKPETPKIIEKEIPLSNKIGSGGTKPDDSWKIEESKNWTIAPAYNKGPYMVVAKEDIKTAGRKV